MDYGPGVVDLLTLGVAAIGYALGRSKGFAWQISGLLTLLGGGACATVLSRPLGPLCGDGLLGRFVAWIAVYALVAVCLYVLTLRFRHRLKELEFDELDRRFGGLLGGIKALSMFALVLLVTVPLSPGIARAVKASYSGRALRGLVHELRALLPEQIHDGFGPWLEAVDPSLGPASPPPVTGPSRPEVPAPAQTTATPASPPRAPAPPPPPSQPPPSPVVRTAPPRAPEPHPDPEDPEPRPDPEPGPDPFDTSSDPTDPLAPPR